ncbi:hypothetical protein HTZ84_08365 [Haloterrigena sp. SYSU A558-1]|uniref:Uncharacterized protein n=1 Tax=Haloterrigena gelatinilytica TaxID=2741724 RepID=A0A8J8GNU2_9EURY|nr:hypothetical protein [Haloterrigena gelatinilytica]NUB91852.1 hypothetical protein [Haloterrigena gelatinilytica]NUC72323.1 hypothetical protein [Haloterrigena gelatinilytica]
MGDADDSGPDTPGTDQEKIDEDARLLGNEPDEDAIDEPTLSQQQEAQETYWMAKEMVAIGVFSILGVILLGFGLMQMSGLLEVPGPFGNAILFVALGALLVAAFAWSQWGT